jgi:hypothetical protein
MTKLSKPGRAKLAFPDVSSITFDPSGNILAGTVMKYGPTIWQVGDPEPLAVLDAPGYMNACTMKVKHSATSCFLSSHLTMLVVGRMCVSAWFVQVTFDEWKTPVRLGIGRFQGLYLGYPLLGRAELSVSQTPPPCNVCVSRRVQRSSR